MSSPSGRPGDEDAVVAVDDAVVVLGDRPVLRGVSARFRRGQVSVLLGPNGSGKSTLVRTIVGRLPLAGGQVRLFGTPVDRFDDWHRIGYVPQRSTATTGVPASVAEVVASGLLARTPWWRQVRPGSKAVAEALAEVGLADRARDPVASLSGGQQQRVLIARALVGKPDLLLMDEPMAGVDFSHQEDFAATVAGIAAAGRTVVLVAHELGKLAPDHTLVLCGGEVLHAGPPRADTLPEWHGHHGVPTTAARWP